MRNCWCLESESFSWVFRTSEVSGCGRKNFRTHDRFIEPNSVFRSDLDQQCYAFQAIFCCSYINWDLGFYYDKLRAHTEEKALLPQGKISLLRD